MMKTKISVIFGTRPEAIKLAPVILALKNDSTFDCQVCVTAQHREMLDQVLEVFGILPDCDLNLMKSGQSLASLTARMVEGLHDYFALEKPDVVLVQGDTTTVLSGALAAYYHRIPVGHVEAGLRTGNLYSPWPEEANRLLTTRLARWHFAPTETSRKNLLAENIPAESIFVTGNTVIDALHLAFEKNKGNPVRIQGLPESLQPGQSEQIAKPRRIVLITGHRRENFGTGFDNICKAIAELARRHPDIHFVYPVHLNPQVRGPVSRVLRSSAYSNVHLIEPLEYLPFIALMKRSAIVLTDSGGIQEEAPSLAKPVLVMRDTTERPEAVEEGTVRLVGTEFDSIVSGVSELIQSEETYNRMAQARNPYGDGKSAQRIVEILKRTGIPG